MTALVTEPPSPMARRRVLHLAAGAATAFAAAGRPSLAAWLDPTPTQLAGPFYPPLTAFSVDNDLLSRGDRSVPVEGQLLYVSGRLLDQRGRPIAGARIEIWQADNDGVYRDSKTATETGDGFQGAGHDKTDGDGRYRFRTIKPAPYGTGDLERTAHIHFLVVPPGGGEWVSQMYFTGEPRNPTDFLLKEVTTGRDRLIRDMVPAGPQAEPGAMAIDFPIIMGMPGVTQRET